MVDNLNKTMSYKCPKCGGGFDEPNEAKDQYGEDCLQCVWCGQTFGEYNPDKEKREDMQAYMNQLDEMMPDFDSTGTDTDGFRLDTDDDNDDEFNLGI